MRRLLVACAAGPLLFGACGHAPATTPFGVRFGSHFREFRLPPAAEMRSSPHRRFYPYAPGRVMDGALELVVPNAIAIRTFEDPRAVFFIDVDGVLLGEKFKFVAFPIVLLLDEDGGGTRVYAHPVRELFDHRWLDHRWLARFGRNLGEKPGETIQAAYAQKCVDYLERLEVELESGRRWPWLSGP